MTKNFKLKSPNGKEFVEHLEIALLIDCETDCFIKL